MTKKYPMTGIGCKTRQIFKNGVGVRLRGIIKAKNISLGIKGSELELFGHTKIFHFSLEYVKIISWVYR